MHYLLISVAVLLGCSAGEKIQKSVNNAMSRSTYVPCGVHIVSPGTSLEFKSHNSGNKYAANEYCLWLFLSLHGFTIICDIVKIQPSASCIKDSLLLSTPSIMNPTKYCPASATTVTLPSQNFGIFHTSLALFTTDMKKQYLGFTCTVSNCPTFATQVGSECFTLETSILPIIWSAARGICNVQGGDLAVPSLTDPSFGALMSPGTSKFWVGAQETGIATNTFNWVTGAAVVPTPSSGTSVLLMQECLVGEAIPTGISLSKGTSCLAITVTKFLCEY